MNTTLPIDDKSIIRAANLMIEQHGPEAWVTATERSEELRLQGFDTVANTWHLIANAIENKVLSKT